MTRASEERRIMAEIRARDKQLRSLYHRQLKAIQEAFGDKPARKNREVRDAD